MTLPQRPPSRSDSDSEGFSHFFRRAYFDAIGSFGYKAMMGILVIVTVACSQIAMLNLLAYEFSAVIGLFVCHFTAALVIFEFDHLRPTIMHRSPYSPGPHPRLVTWGVILGSLAASGWLLFIPLVLIQILGLVLSIRNCDILTGLGFYLTIPVVSSFLCAGLGSFCALGTSSRGKAFGLYWLIVLVFVIRIFLRLARGHTIGLHDPYIGMLSLPLYEQEANLTAGFIFSRLLAFIFGWMAAVLSVMFGDTRFQAYSFRNLRINFRKPDTFFPEIQLTCVMIILMILGLYYQGPMGIEVTRNYLEHELDGTLKTEHFVIHYPTGGEVEDDLDRIAELHEYYYWSINTELESAPDGPIRAYIYPNRVTKTDLTGVGAGVYAKPWTGEIHVEYNRNRINALKHELIHVMSAPMGLPVFGSSILGAYGEGIAEGGEYETGNDLTYHQWAAALREAIDPYTGGPFFQREIAPLQLLTSNFRTGGFYVGRTSMNYYLSASHSRWMLDVYGIDAYKTAYIRNDTERAIGLSQKDAADTWMAYLDHVPLLQDDIAFAEMAFSPPKFTMTVCAHEVAEHERLAREYSSRQQWETSLNEYEILLDFAPDNIRYGYYKALILFYMDEYDSSLALSRDLLPRENCSAAWEAYLILLQGDIFARTDQHAPAADKYREALEVAVNESAENNAILRLEILNSPARDEYLAALREPEDARWHYERAVSRDKSWLPQYFLGLNLANDREFESAEEYLLECLRLNPVHDFVHRRTLYTLGVCAYYQGEYSLANDLFNDAKEFSVSIFEGRHPAYDGVIPVERLDSWTASCAEWLIRCGWRENWEGIGSTTNE